MSNLFISTALALALALPLGAVTELMQLPRIGQKTAERILAFRKQHGGFQRPEELMNVKGIGEKSYAKLKPFLALSAPTATAKK